MLSGDALYSTGNGVPAGSEKGLPYVGCTRAWLPQGVGRSCREQAWAGGSLSQAQPSGARGLPQTSAEREQPASRLFSPLWEGVTGTRLLFRVIPAKHGLKH